MEKDTYSPDFIKKLKATQKRWEKKVIELNDQMDYLEKLKKKQIKAWAKLERCYRLLDRINNLEN